MDFLLECIGFPPDTDVHELASRVERDGESTAWREPTGLHRRLPLAEGLELRLDADADTDTPSLWPYFQSPHRLRVAVERLRRIPDQPYDLLLSGRANPPLPREFGASDDDWPVECYLTDARRLTQPLPPRHVLAVTIAGFALDVSWTGADADAADASVRARPQGARLQPLGERLDPGGCMDVSVRIRNVRHLVNPLTDVPFELLEADAPGRPLQLFVSQWQLEQDHLPIPRPGMRLEGVFVFTGRIAGGLPPLRSTHATLG